jgi:hypothetical protein
MVTANIVIAVVFEVSTNFGLFLSDYRNIESELTIPKTSVDRCMSDSTLRSAAVRCQIGKCDLSCLKKFPSKQFTKAR